MRPSTLLLLLLPAFTLHQALGFHRSLTNMKVSFATKGQPQIYNAAKLLEQRYDENIYCAQ